MSKKVLVIDDDADVRSFVVTVLEENGYVPLQACDGVEGLTKILTDAPDLVILDVLMPRGSGIRLYRRLKTDDALKKLPVVMFTGISKKSFLTSQKVLEEFSGQIPEPDFYIEKPSEPEEIAQAVAQVTGHP